MKLHLIQPAHLSFPLLPSSRQLGLHCVVFLLVLSFSPTPGLPEWTSHISSSSLLLLFAEFVAAVILSCLLQDLPVWTSFPLLSDSPSPVKMCLVCLPPASPSLEQSSLTSSSQCPNPHPMASTFWCHQLHWNPVGVRIYYRIQKLKGVCLYFAVFCWVMRCKW